MAERKDWIAILVLIFLVLAVFGEATLGGIFYFGDIFRLHYPLRSIYAAELQRSSLPLWTPHVFAGYPLLAEGELGALYPPNLLLHTLLPVPIALNVFILGHFIWAAMGAYAFARRLRVGRIAALCSGLVYALGGFLVAHLNHINIVACAAWLPWLFLLTDRFIVRDTPRPRAGDAALLALLIGLEFLAGHPQIALLTFLAVMAYALYLTWVTRPQGKVLIFFAFSVLLGITLSAVQLLPTYELTLFSVRSSGLAPTFFTSFSLHPFYLVSLLSPFVLGNPYPNTSVEWVGYVGWLPLLLALFAPFISPARFGITARTFRPARFFAVMAFLGLLLALGRWNPLYLGLLHLPVFNLFRVPARYLYLFAFSMAMLAGLGLHALVSRVREIPEVVEGGLSWLLIVVIALLTLFGIMHVPTVDQFIDLWRWLPIVLGLLSLGWLAWAWWSKGSAQRILSTIALGLVIIDLFAFNAVFNLTYNQTMPQKQFTTEPRSLSFFRAQSDLYRLYTHEEILPVLSVMQESYYPNIALIHGLSAANGYFPLVPAYYAQYAEQMTPRMLDLLGVKYFLIPQVLPVDEASEFYDVENPFTLNPVGRNVAISPVQVAMVEVESYTSHSVDWMNGQPVAEIKLYGVEGQTETMILRAGWHTAEWAYTRSDVQEVVRHLQAPIARSWPARSGFPPENHPGYAYSAQFRLPSPFTVQAVEVHPLVPAAYLRVERLVLIDAQGIRYQLAHLAHKSDHTLAYRSEDVAVYLNHDVLPRAFVVHKARTVVDDTETLRILCEPDFDPRTEVLLAIEQARAAQPLIEDEDKVEVLDYDSCQVMLRVQAAADGYLVLTDAWYPGWRVHVDGQEAPLLRANLLFRAVYLSAGKHIVEFSYAPNSFRIGLIVSAVSLLLVCGLALRGKLG
ncbi:MAG: YfhO family protein [Anaerolineae bacterium]